MNAMAMLAEGAIVVRDDSKKVIGFVFVEPLANPEGSQIQRWILLDIHQQYRFGPWTAKEGAPASLDTWKAMATTLAPNGLEWGAEPSKGLWVPGAIYVVAQAKPVVPAPNVVPVPTFPRRDEVIAHTLSAGSSPDPTLPITGAGPSAPPTPPLTGPGTVSSGSGRWPQVIIGDYDLRQLSEDRGRCFGDLVTKNQDTETFFESSEYALLRSEWLGAGLAAADPTTLDPKKPDEKGYCQNASEFHAFVVDQYGQGSRYDVIGCNYYRGAAPPPSWFL